ncbi:hypothetical protein [Streptomyces sp. NPDC014006]|uniref:hypothetical protein n=1 Tax=Streptomyces sp. NPDC014006 TaxID=3364870 RepID=UPI0036FE9BC0
MSVLPGAVGGVRGAGLVDAVVVSGGPAHVVLAAVEAVPQQDGGVACRWRRRPKYEVSTRVPAVAREHRMAAISRRGPLQQPSQRGSPCPFGGR